MEISGDKTDAYCIPLNKSNGTLGRREKNSKLKEVRLNKFVYQKALIRRFHTSFLITQ